MAVGYTGRMEHETPEHVESRQVHSRAELLPEEVAAGSDVPDEQAAEVLRDSQRRTEEAVRVLPDAQQRAMSVEHRTSEEATDPVPEPS